MLRVIVRLPTRRAFVRGKSTSQMQSQRLRGDASLADKFNLASLNGGKNPFETSSERLLRGPAKKPKNDSEMRAIYSLEYLMGKETRAATKTKTKTDPFNVPSSKLM